MKKKLVFGLVMILALACVLVSCNSEVSADNNATSAKTGSIVLGKEASKGIGYSVDYSYEVENLYWFYTAVKKDNGYRTGEQTSKVAVKTGEAGLTGKILSGFSYGLWDLTFYGYETSAGPNAEEEAKRAVIYQGSKVNFLVSRDNNYADVDLDVMNAGTIIVFDNDDAENNYVGDGIYFTFDHDVNASEFTLEITDNKGTVNVNNIVNTDKAYTISNSGSEYKVKFSNITYTPGSDILGDHTMTFTLKQVLHATDENVGDIEIEAATYTLQFTVSKGTRTTISGDMTKNNQTGDILINSAALNVEVVVASKVVPIDPTTVVTNQGIKTASVSTSTKVSNGDMSVTYPVGATIITSEDATFSEDGKTSDAETGFEYTSASLSTVAEQASIVLATNQTVAQYELTLNIADTNTTLVKVEKFIGTSLTIDAIYHNGVLMATSASTTETEHEWYAYNDESGYLTLHVFHASPFDIVMKSGSGAGVKYVEAKEPTCTEEGNIAYSYYMNGNQKVIIGGLLENATVDNGGVIRPALGHQFYDSRDNHNNDGYEYCINSGCTASRHEFVAQIDNTSYYTLTDAIAAVVDNTPTTIKLLADDAIKGNTCWVIPSNKDITIDLNGHILKNLVLTGTHSSVIRISNNGKLTLKDSTDENKNGTGSGKIYNQASEEVTGLWPQYNYATNVILNDGGTFILDSGIIECDVTRDSNPGLGYCVDSSSNVANASFTMNGGRLIGARSDQAVRLHYNAKTLNNTFVMNNGVIESGGFWLYHNNVVYTDGNCTVTINNGEINGFVDLKSNGNVTVTINGGTLNLTKLRLRNSDNNSATNYVTITGNAVVNTTEGFVVDDQRTTGDGGIVISGTPTVSSAIPTGAKN